MGSPRSTHTLSGTPSLSLSTSQGPTASQNGTAMLNRGGSELESERVNVEGKFPGTESGLPPSKWGWSSRIGRRLIFRLMAVIRAACCGVSGDVGAQFASYGCKIARTASFSSIPESTSSVSSRWYQKLNRSGRWNDGHGRSSRSSRRNLVASKLGSSAESVTWPLAIFLHDTALRPRRDRQEREPHILEVGRIVRFVHAAGAGVIGIANDRRIRVGWVERQQSQRSASAKTNSESWATAQRPGGTERTGCGGWS